jgi:hypothetical protein
MPHIPDSLHETHDLELVAAFAAGDATGPALDAATTLVASCATCAQLHQDLRSIAAAMPAVPAPARTRDFRISHEQAARLRPTGIRGILAAFGSPRLSFAAPLGTGMAALGIIGVLVASGGAPLGGATDGAGVDTTTRITIEASQEAGEGVGGEAPGQASASDGPAASGAPAQQPDGNEAPSTPDDQADVLAASAPPDLQVPEDSDVAAARPADQTMLIVGGALAIVGLALLALRWAGRRLV